ncbi:ankyrin repeat domain-containing protein [Hymenobacter cavernae]|uniref:Ankyrin repeat domain-containing protein n=1 Tax=Hymenobacter cavernae TaxID=2044852 RepID=A0ABQ1UW72_9BACT|nr:ankyrin repeat domain-containing protein [Hymenobacter cavernae]GGF28508.1 hypothetical protein GCM10011383_45300 [Hymenobacter cavernae]
MLPSTQRLLVLLWILTLLVMARGSVTAYVGPLNWLSALLLWASGFYSMLVSVPQLPPKLLLRAPWVLYLLGAAALTLSFCYFARSPVHFTGWFIGLVSVLLLLAFCATRTSQLALLATIALLVLVPGLLLRHTSLLPSIAAGSEPHVRLLLACGANVNAIEQHDTPLIAAVNLGRADLVELLLQQGADPNGRSSAFMNHTPVLFDAARLPADQQRVLALLLQYGADPNLTNGSGETALVHALRFKQPQNAQALRAAGARSTP